MTILIRLYLIEKAQLYGMILVSRYPYENIQRRKE